MQTLVVALVVSGSIGGLAAVGWLSNTFSKWNDIRLGEKRRAKLYDERVAELNRLDQYKKELDEYRAKIERWRAELSTVIAQKTEGFPWLAQAFADYFHLEGLREADRLQYKKHPAPVAAGKVREIATQRREAETELRVAKYLLRYYENLFPWLVDFRGEDLDDLIQRKLERHEQVDEIERGDPARIWLTEAEFASLPAADKYQLALDRYWTKPKSSWEIGRDYERFIGYLYEKEGWAVTYQGIAKGYEDLGRDLIARNGDNVEIVQCKNWSQSKTIHEKHIFQLYGTVIAYRVDNPGQKVKARFVTSTNLSDRAKQFASLLEIECVENYRLQRYPCVKCNVSRRDSEKIYHLPFDQQYDTTIIEEERLERYVATVAEAEQLGFRRALRWRGNKVSSKT